MTETESEKILITQSDYCCAHCGENAWRLSLGHEETGRTFLIVQCTNNSCIEERKKELDITDDEMIIWEEFDITGQGYDEEELDKDNPSDWN